MTVSDDRPPRRSTAAGEPTQSRGGGRRFSDREVAVILKRASELQTTDTGETEIGGGMSLEELRDVAREAGIDPRLITRAAGEMDAPPDRNRSSPLAGAPMEVVLERTIEGEVPEEELEILVDRIRRTFGEPGQVSTVGRSIMWSSSSHGAGYGRRGMGRLAYVSISIRNGSTTIRVEEQMKPLAGQMFGAIMGGVGGGSGGIFMGIGMGVFHSAPAAFGLWGLWITASYLFARGFFSMRVDRRVTALHELMNRLVDHVAETAVVIPRLPRNAARRALATPEDDPADGDPSDA